MVELGGLKTKIWFSGEGQKLGPEEGGPGFPELRLSRGRGSASNVSLTPSLPPSTGNIFQILRVQGCTSQPGCDLLNGTQEIGSIKVSEDCRPNGECQGHKKHSLGLEDPLAI